MSALAEALVAAQRRALTALEKQAVAGKVDGDAAREVGASRRFRLPRRIVEAMKRLDLTTRGTPEEIEAHHAEVFEAMRPYRERANRDG